MSERTITTPYPLGEESTITTKKFFAQGWGKRHTLELMGFLGFVLLYSMRFNLSISIVQMVNHDQELTDTKLSISNNLNEDYKMCPNVKLMNASSTEFLTSNNSMDNFNKSYESPKIGTGMFSWTEKEQGLILGSFFWGYVATQYPGGRLSHKYGSKWIFSIGILISGVLSLLLPIVTIQMGKTGLIIIRVLQGLAQGVTFPSMHVMIAHWSPPEERSRMANLIFSGVPIGTAVTMVIGGYLINFFGWPSLFYTVGILTIIWFGFWIFLVFDNPSKHPRISSEELDCIESAIKGQTVKEDLPTPWRAISLSLPVWAIFIIHFGHSWGHYLMHTEVPKYINSVHHFNIEDNGWLSASPQLLNFCVCIVMSHISDFLIVKKITSIIFTRKLCSTIALWGSAAAFFGMILGGCNTILAIVCLNIAGAAMGGGFAGWIVNNIDIAPNHAGTMMGVENAVSNCLGFVAPFVTGIILHTYPSLTGWRIVFLIPTVINVSVNTLYLIFAKAEEQSWNRPKQII